MENNFFNNLPENTKKRMSYIEGRSELFETKVLKIEPDINFDKNVKNILIISRDPGSANALSPVIRKLIELKTARITAMTDGKAEEILEKNFKTKNITPETMVLGADKMFETPNVILVDASSSEIGLDTYAFATFPEVPKVLIEDYYSTAKRFISVLAERKLPMPEKICVMDKGAKKIITDEFPDLEERIIITGQPSFDKFSKENTEMIAKNTREKLHISFDDNLVVFMATNDEIEKMIQLAEALRLVENDFYFVFRRHPRDNVSYNEYERVFIDRGIKLLNTNQFTTDEISAAADVILTTWSIEGINSIYRRKPTVNIVDNNFKIPKDLVLPLVPVKLGASIGVDNASEIISILPQLLDRNSDLNKSLRENMEKNYLNDGNNAERIAKEINNLLEK